jgi:protein phosphatase
MTSPPPSASALFSFLSHLVTTGIDQYIMIPGSFALAPIDLEVIADLCANATAIFSTEPIFLDLTGDFMIVGDLHGHVLELLRILITFGLPPTQRYIFLGDLIDRGDFSLHTLSYIFALKCVFPDRVYIIRGNHEFEAINSSRGLLTEITEVYQSTPLYETINAAFAHLPIALRLNGTFLCVHGGIGPDVVTLQQIAALQRPITTFDDPIVESLMWSDPDPAVTFQKSSRRDYGFEYGESALCEFLDRNELRLLIRGHQAISDGVKYELGGKVVTVFSVSNYCELVIGVAGVLEVTADGVKEHRLPTLPYVFRKLPVPRYSLPKDRVLSCAAPGAPLGRPPIVKIGVLKPRPCLNGRRNSAK